MNSIQSNDLFKMIQEKYQKNIIARLYDDPRLDTYYINILPKICIVFDGVCEYIDTISIVRIPSLDNNDMNYEEFNEFINSMNFEDQEELFMLELDEYDFNYSETNFKIKYLERKNKVFEILNAEFEKLEANL